MKEEQAELKRTDGGLSIPNICTELMTMSVTAVSHWATTSSSTDQTMGEILLDNKGPGPTYIMPLDAARQQPCQLQHNMWKTGAMILSNIHSKPYDNDERDGIMWCSEHFKPAFSKASWNGDWLHLDLTSKMNERLPDILLKRRQSRGTFCGEWLPYTKTTTDGWLLDPTGTAYRLATSSVASSTTTLGDIMRWEWVRRGVLKFMPRNGISAYSRPSIRAFERLCAALVYNFPQLLYRPHRTNVLRPYNGQSYRDHEWHLSPEEKTLTHFDTTLTKATHKVQSAIECDRMATKDTNGHPVQFHAHPCFSRLIQLWGGAQRWAIHRARHRQQVEAVRKQVGEQAREAAIKKAVHSAGPIWNGMQLVAWNDIHKVPRITVYASQTLLRLKANKLSLWNHANADLSCPHSDCHRLGQTSVQHLFWECPNAKRIWKYFFGLWEKVGITPGQDPVLWIFSLDLPDTPRRAWDAIRTQLESDHTTNEKLQDHLYTVAQMLWRYMTASLIHAIWCARLRSMESEPPTENAQMAIVITRLEAGMCNLSRLAFSQAEDAESRAAATVLKGYVNCLLDQTSVIPLIPNSTRGVYLLFFDGGSRGNPGPGGSGSVIVRVQMDSHTASIVWVASMAYSRQDTTNNIAEYWGLIHGLREAQRSKLEPLHVVGDSALILSQQRLHRPPRQQRLAQLYRTSRRLADCIDIRGWYHHYRAFNKMADKAANIAMDTKSSAQCHFPSTRTNINEISRVLDNDVLHWIMRVSIDPRGQHNTKQPSVGPRERAILVKDYLAMLGGPATSVL
jgi:ribonuclease HI